MWLKTEDGTMRQIGKVGIEADLYWECKEFPFKLMRYREVDSQVSLAEMATADVEIAGKKFRFEILAPGAGTNAQHGASVSLQSIPLQGRSKQKKSE